MRLWLQIRGAPIVLATMAVTVAALALPASALAATPSPAGATLAAACLLALAVPVAVGWGCARGDAQLESVGVRPIRAFDFLLAVLAVGATSAAALAMQQAGLAPAGAIAGRAALTYLGFMLLASPLAGWRHRSGHLLPRCRGHRWWGGHLPSGPLGMDRGRWW